MIRTFNVNYRKNWVIKPSQWNLFWSNLEKDIAELKTEIEAQNFNVEDVFETLEYSFTKAGLYERTKYPRL